MTLFSRPLVLSTLIALCLLLGACAKDLTAEDHLENARGFIVEGDATSAYIELKNALNLDPQIAEIHWLLGDLFLRTGNPGAAESFLQQAADREWPADKTQPALARTKFELQRYSEVLAFDPSALAPEGAAEVLALQALAHMALGDTGAAKKSVAEAQLQDPDASEPQLALALILSEQQQTAEARQILEKTLENDPQNARGWHLLGLVKLQQGLHTEAREDFTQAIENAPIWPEPLLHRALTNLRLRDMAAARGDAALLDKVGEGTPGNSYVQGLIHLEDKNYREVLGALSEAGDLTQQYPLINYALARAFFLTGKEEDAQRTAQAYFEHYPNNINARTLLGALYIRAEDYTSARSMLQPVLDQNPANWQALQMMAALEAREGELDRSLTLYRWLSQAQPEKPLVAAPEGAELVEAALRQKQTASTDTTESTDDASVPAEQAIVEIANALSRKDFDTAIAKATDLQWAESTNLGGHHVLTRVYLQAERPRDANLTIIKALKRDAYDPTSNIILANLALAKDETKGARFRLKRILEEYPHHLATLLHIASLDARAGNMSIFTARLERAIHAHPKSPTPRLILAGHYLRQGDIRYAIPALEPLIPLQRAAPAIAGTILLAALAQGENAIDQETLERLLRAQPGTEFFNYVLVTTARQRQRLGEVKSALQTVLQYSTNHVPTALGLALIAQLEGDKERFLAYADALETLQASSRSSLVLQVLADAKATRGDNEAALAFAKAAYEQTPNSATLFKLTGHQLRLGDTASAKLLMEEWLVDKPDDNGIRLRLGQLNESLENLDAAESQYRAVLQQTPENPIALNNLAWLLREKDTKEALKYIHKALKAAPDQPQLLDTAAVIAHLDEKSPSALLFLRKALQLQPKYTSARYHLAMILEATGKKEQAQETLEKLMEEAPEEFPERADAEALLQKLRSAG